MKLCSSHQHVWLGPVIVGVEIIIHNTSAYVQVPIIIRISENCFQLWGG